MKHLVWMLACASFSLQADTGAVRTGPLEHAPIGVMGDHTHAAGEWMFSYRYMSMNMSGNRDGSDSLSTAQVLQRYMVAPTAMRMQMHMFGAMYAPSDAVTLMAMLPYQVREMDHVTRMGVAFRTKSRGVGDARIAALVPLHESGADQVHLNLGLSLPTGDIDARDDTPVGPHRLLPYPMQLGSGTYDLHPALTWNHRQGAWAWGAQLGGVLRIGRNSRDYSLGDEVSISSWGAKRLGEMLSASLRVSGKRWGDIDGADRGLNPAMVPTADPQRRGGRKISVDAGLNLLFPNGHRLAMELGAPLYQHLDGPQMDSDATLMIGWQKAL